MGGVEHLEVNVCQVANTQAAGKTWRNGKWVWELTSFVVDSWNEFVHS